MRFVTKLSLLRRLAFFTVQSPCEIDFKARLWSSYGIDRPDRTRVLFRLSGHIGTYRDIAE